MEVSAVRNVKRAQKPYSCDWCCERIEAGERYKTWFTFGEAVTARMHPECYTAMGKAGIDDELPPPGTFRRGCSCGEIVELCQCREAVR